MPRFLYRFSLYKISKFSYRYIWIIFSLYHWSIISSLMYNWLILYCIILYPISISCLWDSLGSNLYEFIVLCEWYFLELLSQRNDQCIMDNLIILCYYEKIANQAFSFSSKFIYINIKIKLQKLFSLENCIFKIIRKCPR